MKQTKQFLRPLLMAIVMLVGMLVPQEAWAQDELEVNSDMTITEDCSYERINVYPGSTLTISEGVKVQVEFSINIMSRCTVINYGTIIGDVDVDGTFANHGHVTTVNANGTFYNTGTCDDLAFGSVTPCSHTRTTSTGVQVDATCTHGAGKQYRCNTCSYIGIKETGDPLPHDIHDHNGLKVCSMCGQMTFDAPTVGDGTAENPYQIANAGHLYWFADKVNKDNATYKSANAILTADIVVNDGTFAADGSFTATGATAPIEWLVIGRFDDFNYNYAGTFDGQGHTISGLYANYSCSGLFGLCDGATIKNEDVINSYFEGSRAGALCGSAGENVEISNCYSSNVTCKGAYVGGIIGQLSNSSSSIIKNCYSTSSLINTDGDNFPTGGIAGTMSGSTINCYTTYEKVNDWSNSLNHCEAGVSAERFASGEIAWLLNGSVDGEGNWTAGATDGTQKWYQKIGTDTKPVLAAAEGNTVYYGYESCVSENMSYSNSSTALYATKEEAHSFENKTLTAEPDEHGLYAYVCDHGCGEHGDYNVVKANNASEGESTTTIELTSTTEGGTTTYTAAAPVAVPDGAFSTPVDFTATGAQVSIARTFTAETPATINLPFDVPASAMSETYYTFGGIEYNAEKGKWEATMVPATGTLTANTPYIVMPSGTSLGIKDNAATVSFKANASTNSTTTSGLWTMTAAKAPKTWAAGDVELGKAYGFAANSGTAANGEAVAAGQFVMVAAGASIAAGRAYLKYTGETSPFTRAADAQLPASISVIFKHADATGIGTLNTETGAFTFDGWYDLQGRRVSEPAKGGVIMNNNKKIIVK